ncbi:MAG: hypothetical protein RLY93_09130 [Sumerlaeia bacterium]
MFDLTQFLIDLHGAWGNAGFLTLSTVLSLVLAFIAIPKFTDVMVNSAAGLAGKHLGRRSRTLIINASTNNPEAASMLVSFAMRRMGGWANPLGSLFANIYLMYGVALIYVFAKFWFTGQREKAAALWKLLKKERRLAAYHFVVSFLIFLLGFAALRVLMGDGQEPAFDLALVLTMALLLAGVGIFLVFDRWLKTHRPELLDDIDAEHHNESWTLFFVGTAGVIASTYVMNALFLAWSDIYDQKLTGLFGLAVFTWLHWFLGSLITSLPEITVAIKNYQKVTPPELNTALGSVTYSNMVNLLIALLGLLVWMIMASLGVHFLW